MGTQPNITGIARLVYVVGGVAAAGWGLWGAAQGWTQWVWLALGGTAFVLGLIGYSPLHAWFGKKDRRPE